MEDFTAEAQIIRREAQRFSIFLSVPLRNLCVSAVR